MTELTIALMLMLSAPAPADRLACSIRASKTSTAADLLARVNVSYADAVKAALAGTDAPAEVIGAGDLEIQRGCLVYAFEVRTAAGAHAMWIDAGDGKLLSAPFGNPERASALLPKGKSTSR